MGGAELLENLGHFFCKLGCSIVAKVRVALATKAHFCQLFTAILTNVHDLNLKRTINNTAFLEGLAPAMGHQHVTPQTDGVT